VTINNITYTSVGTDPDGTGPATTFQATIAASALNVNGGPLTAGQYSLFLRGDQVHEVESGALPIARPGEIVVANSKTGTVSTLHSTARASAV